MESGSHFDGDGDDDIERDYPAHDENPSSSMIHPPIVIHQFDLITDKLPCRAQVTSIRSCPDKYDMQAHLPS